MSGPWWRRGAAHQALRAAYRVGDELRLRTRRVQPRRPRRVLLAYWGSVEGGRPTIGDELAVVALARWLGRRGIDADVASTDALPDDVRALHPARVSPQRYGCMVFVCGPLTSERSLLRFAHRFAHVPRVAVGVSVLAEQRHVQRFYDTIVARDGRAVGRSPAASARFDLALSGEATDVVPPYRSDGTVLFCLRGAQGEYGRARCRSAQAEALLDGVAARIGRPRASVDTVLANNAGGAADVERAFAGASLVLTTRLHGALLALRAGVPFVAVDQIAGGAKLSEVLGALGYPFVYRVDVVTPEQLEEAARSACSEDFRPRLLELRAHAIELSRAALEEAGHAVERSL